jgi:hypothetical protein
MASTPKSPVNRAPQPPSHPGGPGWFSRSPAMAVLATRLQSLRSSSAFQGLRALIQPAASFANAILARLAGREPVHPRWQGQLHLDRHAQAGRQPRQPIFRRLVERISPTGSRQRALHTLSLPADLLETLPPAFGPDIPEDQDPREEFAPSWIDSAPELDSTHIARAEAAEPIGPTAVLPATAARQPAHTYQAGSTPPQAKEAPAAFSRQASAWPFQLVQPRQNPAATRSAAQQSLSRSPQSPEAAPARPIRQVDFLSGQTRDVNQLTLRSGITQRSAEPLPPRTSQPATMLPARSMTLQQPQMPVTTVPFPAMLARPEPTREASPDQSQEISHPHPGPLATSVEHPGTPHTSAAAFERMAPSERPAQPAALRAPRPTQGGLTLLRTPAVMMGLSPAAHSERTESNERREPGQLSETSQRPSPSRLTAALVQPRPIAQPPAVEQTWPLFGVLRQLANEPQPVESSALQHLRRMWPQSQIEPAVTAAVEASAALGPGEPLTPELRRQMQPHLDRPLGEVRLHTSPIAQMLRAEAFTSGQHIVFAPGRLDPTTPTGLALLGHELTHLGQPLAFKTESSAGTVHEDSGEQAARQQEEKIHAVIENGWPQPTGRAYRHTPQPHAPTAGFAGSGAAVQRAVVINEMEATPAQQDGEAAQGSNGQNAAQAGSGQSSGQAGRGAPSAAPAANIDVLAKQVYSILKDRLRAERTRHDLYGR